MPTIKEMIAALDNTKGLTELPNTAETWERIQAKDSFEELGLDSSKLKSFIANWVNNNEYSNIA